MSAPEIPWHVMEKRWEQRENYEIQTLQRRWDSLKVSKTGSKQLWRWLRRLPKVAEVVGATFLGAPKPKAHLCSY